MYISVNGQNLHVRMQYKVKENSCCTLYNELCTWTFFLHVYIMHFNSVHNANWSLFVTVHWNHKCPQCTQSPVYGFTPSRFWIWLDGRVKQTGCAAMQRRCARPPRGNWTALKHKIVMGHLVKKIMLIRWNRKIV